VKPRDAAALLALGALWGGSFLFIRVAVSSLGPLLLMALNAAIPFTLIAAAEIHLTASLAAILNSTTVMFAAVAAAVWSRDPLTARKVVGIVLGVIGVAVLVGWDPVELDGAVLLSVGAMLAASLSYGISAVYVKRTFVGVPPLGMAIGQLTGATVVLFPFAALSVPGESPPVAATASVLALALLSTALAYLFYFRLITNVGPTSTVTVTLLVPVFGLLFGVLFLDEPFGPGTLAGLGIVLGSVVLVTGVGFGKRDGGDLP
jgi:drug/metabolite transporter (DMT)-like permease